MTNFLENFRAAQQVKREIRAGKPHVITLDPLASQYLDNLLERRVHGSEYPSLQKIDLEAFLHRTGLVHFLQIEMLDEESVALISNPDYDVIYSRTYLQPENEESDYNIKFEIQKRNFQSYKAE